MKLYRYIVQDKTTKEFIAKFANKGQAYSFAKKTPNAEVHEVN